MIPSTAKAPITAKEDIAVVGEIAEVGHIIIEDCVPSHQANQEDDHPRDLQHAAGGDARMAVPPQPGKEQHEAHGPEDEGNDDDGPREVKGGIQLSVRRKIAHLTRSPCVLVK